MYSNIESSKIVELNDKYDKLVLEINVKALEWACLGDLKITRLWLKRKANFAYTFLAILFKEFNHVSLFISLPKISRFDS